MTALVTKQAILVPATAMDGSRVSERLALFNDDGEPVLALTFEEIPTGADIVLTGYTAGTATDVAATDTVAEGIAKVEAKADVGTGVLLTGFVTGANTTVLATDTLLEALQKLQGQIDALGT